MQARYGWTDEIIHGLLWVRFNELAQMSADARTGEANERLILAAFVGWQMGAGGKSTFGDYLNGLGLSGEVPQSKSPAFDQAVQDAKLKSMGIVEVKK